MTVSIIAMQRHYLRILKYHGMRFAGEDTDILEFGCMSDWCAYLGEGGRR